MGLIQALASLTIANWDPSAPVPAYVSVSARPAIRSAAARISGRIVVLPARQPASVNAFQVSGVGSRRTQDSITTPRGTRAQRDSRSLSFARNRPAETESAVRRNTMLLPES